MNCKKMSSKDFTITNTIINDNEIWSGYHKDYTPLTNDPKPIIFKIIENCTKVKIIVNNNIKKFDEFYNLQDMYVVYNLL